MSQPPPTPPSRSLQIVKIVLYILAGLALVVGLIAGISLWTSATNMVANALLPLHLLGAGTIADMITSALSGFLKNLGIITILISFLLSALLYAIGRLIGHITLLEERIARLETRF